jgi:hypothetical protein
MITNNKIVQTLSGISSVSQSLDLWLEAGANPLNIFEIDLSNNNLK